MKIVHFKNLEKSALAKVIRDSEVYKVSDITLLKELVLSKTTLHPHKQTTGHSHDTPEIYIFMRGRGKIKVNEEVKEVAEGDIVLIEPKSFHQVINHTKDKLEFLCIFKPYGERGKV